MVKTISKVKNRPKMVKATKKAPKGMARLGAMAVKASKSPINTSKGKGNT